MNATFQVFGANSRSCFKRGSQIMCARHAKTWLIASVYLRNVSNVLVCHIHKYCGVSTHESSRYASAASVKYIRQEGEDEKCTWLDCLPNKEERFDAIINGSSRLSCSYTLRLSSTMDTFGRKWGAPTTFPSFSIFWLSADLNIRTISIVFVVLSPF